MLERLNHIAIAVPNLEDALKPYAFFLKMEVSLPLVLPEHGVRVVFLEVGNTKIELMEPLGENSPILGFLKKNPQGGVHHLCYEVKDILRARDHLLKEGARLLGDGIPKVGAHGKPVLFLHPKDFSGTLVELEECSK